MKINSQQKSINHMTDLNEVYAKLKEDNRSVFFYKAEEDFFFYRTLTRKEYKLLVENESISDMEKEDIVCEACVLWPMNYDFEDCEAGIPTMLTKEIMKSSFLDSVESKNLVVNHYRSEMFELDNQVNCIINEAFPQYDIEDIEKWDIERTAKYLSRAEWKLVNLRGMSHITNPFAEEEETNEQQPQQENRAVTQEITDDFMTEDENKQRIISGDFETIEERNKRLSSKGKERMTPEKLMEMKAKFPEIDWDDDAVLQRGEKALEQKVDSTPTALRPGM